MTDNTIISLQKKLIAQLFKSPLQPATQAIQVSRGIGLYNYSYRRSTDHLTASISKQLPAELLGPRGSWLCSCLDLQSIYLVNMRNAKLAVSQSPK